MKCTRRELAIVLPALLASASRAAEKRRLAAKAYRFEDLPARANGENRFHSVLEGETHTGFAIELHESDLGPGRMPHASHHHEHEEIFLVREGTLEVDIAGEKTRLGPGSVAYIASNVEHGIRNVGTTRAQYFVIALGSDRAPTSR